MKKIFIIIFLCYCWNISLSQQSFEDSVINILKHSPNDSNKVNILLELNKIFLADDPEKAYLYAHQAKILSEKIKYSKGRAYAYKGMGLVTTVQGKYVDAIENYERSLAIFDSLHDKRGVANILSNEGAVFHAQADYAKALDLLLKGLQVAEQTTDSLRIATLLVNIGAVYAETFGTYKKALDNYFRALQIGKSIDNTAIMGITNVNIGEIYFKRGEYEQALKYFQESLSIDEESENFPYTLNYIGKLYVKKGDYAKAIKYHQQAYDYAKKLDASLDLAQSLIGLGDTYRNQNDEGQAIRYYKEAEPIALNISKANNEIKNTYSGLAKAYASISDYKNAFSYQTLLTQVKDSLYNIDAGKKLSGLQFHFDMQKKEAEVDLLTKDKQVQALEIKRQNVARKILLGGLAFAFIIAGILYRNYRNKIKVNKLLDSQKAEIEALVLNILPAEVADELKKNAVATPRFYEKASVLFTDFKSFSRLADELSPQEVVSELNDCFVAFDEIIEKHNLEKIKTIGDSYMCAGGIPTPDDAHVLNIIRASLDIQAFILQRNRNRAVDNLPPWDIRIGINTGPLVAGVVGKKKFAYDIWGTTVNIASRMESNGEPGKVNISAATYELIKDKYACTYRGKISAKNIGEIDMYFVEGELNMS